MVKGCIFASVSQYIHPNHESQIKKNWDYLKEEYAADQRIQSMLQSMYVLNLIRNFVENKRV